MRTGSSLQATLDLYRRRRQRRGPRPPPSQTRRRRRRRRLERRSRLPRSPTSKKVESRWGGQRLVCRFRNLSTKLCVWLAGASSPTFSMIPQWFREQWKFESSWSSSGTSIFILVASTQDTLDYNFYFSIPRFAGWTDGWMDENGAGLVSNVSASLEDDSSVLGERKKRTFVGESRSLERRRLIGSELIWRILRPIWDKLLVFRESKFENGPRGKLECAKERKRNAIKLFSPTLSFHSIQRCKRERGIWNVRNNSWTKKRSVTREEKEKRNWKESRCKWMTTAGSHEGQEKSLTRKLFNEKLCCRGSIDASLSNPRRWEMGISKACTRPPVS